MCVPLTNSPQKSCLEINKYHRIELNAVFGDKRVKN